MYVNWEGGRERILDQVPWPGVIHIYPAPSIDMPSFEYHTYDGLNHVNAACCIELTAPLQRSLIFPSGVLRMTDILLRVLHLE